MAVNHRRANFERLLRNIFSETPRSTLNTKVFNNAKKHLSKYPGLNYNPNRNNATVRNIVNSKGFKRQVNEAKNLIAATKKLLDKSRVHSPMSNKMTSAAMFHKWNVKTPPSRTRLSPPRKRFVGVSPRRLF